MKFLVLSDVHGNFTALKAVLDAVDKTRYDRIIALGDNVGDGPCPDKVLLALEEKQALMIQGNREQLAVDHFAGLPATQDALQWEFMRASLNFLSLSQRQLMAGLPGELTVKVDDVSIRAVHGSPDSVRELLYASNQRRLQECLEQINENILLCGHNHHQFAYLYEDKLTMNPGSVGLSQAGEPFRADYGLLNVNGSQFSFELNHVYYDGDAAKQDYIERNLWEFNIWGQLAWREMSDGKRYIVGFARHVFALAKAKHASLQPISDDIWREACSTWEWTPAD